MKWYFSKNLQIVPIFSYGVIYLMGVNLILLVLALLPSALWAGGRAICIKNVEKIITTQNNSRGFAGDARGVTS